MQKGNIYYLIPDVFIQPFNLIELLRRFKKHEGLSYINDCIRGRHRPIGGIKMHYLHTQVLQELGYSATPLVLGRFDGDFWSYAVKPQHISEVGFNLGRNDIVVATEFMPYDGLRFSGCKRLLFAQNWINIDRRLAPEDSKKSYLDLGYDQVLTCSRYISEILQESMGIDSDIIPNGIDPNMFFADAKLRQNERVFCLPRKNLADLARIKKIVLRQRPETVFCEGEQLTEKEIASEYRKSDIFLATGYPEGFGLPPLEAMFSGCAVTGFTGGGALEFMRHQQTALVANDGDCESAAAHLLTLLNDPALKERLRTAGTAIAKNYTREQMARNLKMYYQEIMKSP